MHEPRSKRNQQGMTMGKKLYVGNLPANATEADLEEAFAAIGVTVESARIITDHATGASRGFGFVEMMNERAAQRAIDHLGKMTLKGRRLRINEARETRVLRA